MSIYSSEAIHKPRRGISHDATVHWQLKYVLRLFQMHHLCSIVCARVQKIHMQPILLKENKNGSTIVNDSHYMCRWCNTCWWRARLEVKRSAWLMNVSPRAMKRATSVFLNLMADLNFS